MKSWFFKSGEAIRTPDIHVGNVMHTDAAASTESISCGDGEGVTNTVTTGVQDAGLVRLVEAWSTLPEDHKQSILELLRK
ncbi:hypothetical protein OAG62_00080 [bacterium]|nr:hypothetical protein [bacterium]